MKKKNIFNGFNGFLIFVLFFNFLFFSMEDVFALSQETVVGPRDRIRKFDELNFQYIPPDPEGKNLDVAGFSCKPGGLKFFETKKITGLKSFDDVLAWSYDGIVNIFLFPVLCIGIMAAFGQATNGNNLLVGIGALLSALGLYGIDCLYNIIFNEDDYNLDPNNPYCFGVALAMLVGCMVMMLIFKIRIRPWIKVIIILDVSLSMYVTKNVIKHIQYKKANEIFDQLSLCGDNWFTYGGNELERVIGGRSILKEVKNAWDNFIRTDFPIKGIFLGSYQYKLNECFLERNIMFCRNLFNDQSLTSNDINNRFDLKYKQYREFFYGGVEYSYSGCKDPRITRKTYLSTNNFDSQLYYFRGNEAANFACERFLENGSKEYREAYECCLEASQKLICISDNKQKIHTMCDKDLPDGKCAIFGDYDIDENVTLSNEDYCSNLKNNLKENSSEICSQEDDNNTNFPNNNNTNIINSCSEIDEYYSQVCDENGNVKNIDKSLEAPKEGKSNQIKFKISQSQYDSTGSKYCVETYNLCPYNFRLLGGTEKYGMEFSPSYGSKSLCPKNNDSDDNKNNCSVNEDGTKHCMGPCYSEEETLTCFGKPSNFCQIDRHCVKIPKLDSNEKYYASPYLDYACINNVGSSHNFDNYSTAVGATFSSTKLLTAPIVECTVETFKNILMNRAGHTACTDLKDTIVNDKCMMSDVLYKKGQELTEAGYNSPIKRIMNYLRGLIKAVMALSVLLYGYNIIILKKGATPEEIMKFILTMLFVSYFSFSNNWMPYIFDNVYKVYNRVAEFGVEILSENNKNDKDPYEDSKYGGCYFLNSQFVNNNYDLYGSRKYLAVFDKFDCEFARYIGYSRNNVKHPSIIAIFVLGLLTFGLNILMILPFVLLFVSLIFFLIRIAYIFIVNSLTITILLFMTPIFVPMILFERTKGMFKSWITKILQSVLSPLFIFMSLSMFFVIFNKYYFGDVEFSGKKEPYRDIYCGIICKIDSNNTFHVIRNSDYAEECNRSGGKIIDLTTSTPICFISQTLNRRSDSGNSAKDFFITSSFGVVLALSDISASVSIFFSVIFLLLIVFLFEQMIGYVNSMTSVIFGSESGGYSGVDDTASGLPTLQQTLGVIANAGAKLSNSVKNIPKSGVNNIINHYERKKEDKARRATGQTVSNMGSNSNNDTSSGEGSEEKNENK